MCVIISVIACIRSKLTSMACVYVDQIVLHFGSCCASSSKAYNTNFYADRICLPFHFVCINHTHTHRDNSWKCKEYFVCFGTSIFARAALLSQRLEYCSGFSTHICVKHYSTSSYHLILFIIQMNDLDVEHCNLLHQLCSFCSTSTQILRVLFSSLVFSSKTMHTHSGKKFKKKNIFQLVSTILYVRSYVIHNL